MTHKKIQEFKDTLDDREVLDQLESLSNAIISMVELIAEATENSETPLDKEFGYVGKCFEKLTLALAEFSELTYELAKYQNEIVAQEMNAENMKMN